MRHRTVAVGFVVLLLGVSAAAAGVYVLRGGAAGGEQAAPFTVRDVAAEVGFNYTAGGRGISNTNAGVYVSDYDHNGYPDVLALGGAGPVLFENTGGEFRRANALPEFEATITAALFLDYDGDGWEDLLLLPLPGSGTDADRPDDRPLLFGNTGGEFTYRGAVAAELAGYPTGATTADYDGDGRLDVFVWQNGDWSDRTPVGFRNPDTIGNITGDNGQVNLLLRGTGSGFENVTAAAGIAGERWSIAASFVDLTGDGLPDIHVANDFNEDILYVNEGDGTFRQVRLGRATDRNQMSSEIVDVNDDGRPDIFVTNIFSGSESADASKDTGQSFENRDQYMQGGRAKGNNLLVNRGGGAFVDRAAEYGVRRSGDLWGWAAVLVDLDNDGDPDLVHANNEKNSVTTGGGSQLVASPTPPAVWEFSGGRFVSLNPVKLGFEKQDGRGMAQLDYDLDGDVDIVLANNKGRYRLYENRRREPDAGGLFGGGTSNHALQVLVRGDDTYLGHGATVTVTVGNRTEYRFVTAKVDYLSQDSRVLHVGLGTHETVDRIRVTWPDGTTRTLTDVAADRRLVVYPDGTVETTPLKAG